MHQQAQTHRHTDTQTHRHTDTQTPGYRGRVYLQKGVSIEELSNCAQHGCTFLKDLAHARVR